MRIGPGTPPAISHAAAAYRASSTSTSPRRSTPSALVAAHVPGRVDFTHDDSASMRLHAHPADGNAAATGIAVGRVLDVQG